MPIWLLLGLFGVGAYVVTQSSGTTTTGPGGSGSPGSTEKKSTRPNPEGWPSWAPSLADCENSFAALPPEIRTAVQAGIQKAFSVKPFDKAGAINLAKELETFGHKQAGLCIRALIEMADGAVDTKTEKSLDPSGGGKGTSVLAVCDETVSKAVTLLPEPLRTQVLTVYKNGGNAAMIKKLADELSSTGHPAMKIVADCLKKKFNLYTVA